MRLPKYLIFKLKASCEKVNIERIELEQLLDEERPHGEWENCGGVFCARCSVCKEVAYETAGNFYPNCGADMREGD